MKQLRKKHSIIKNVLLPLSIQISMAEKALGMIMAIPEKTITQTVSEYAEENRVIGKGLTANPGPFDYNLTPYLREIVDCLSDSSPILDIAVIKPTQVGFTVGVLENHTAYCIEHGIGPGLYIGGDDAMAQDQCEKRIDDAIYECGLQEKVKSNIIKKHGHSTGDRKDSKSYGGTFFRFIGPNSESKAASFPSRVVHGDEADKWPVKLVKNGVDSGDIWEKITRRQDSYGPLRKTILGSSPKRSSISRVNPAVNASDKRYYHITCPKCGFQQPMLWNNFKWNKKEDGSPDIEYGEINGTQVLLNDPTYLECANPDCDYHITQKEKYELMLEKGRGGTAEWIPSKKPDKPFSRSYVINGLMGFRKWSDIMLQFLEVKDDPLRFPDFVNDVLGEVYIESQEKPDHSHLFMLSQEFEHWPRGFIKKEIIWLSVTCDVQGSYLEYSLCGHARENQHYTIDTWVSEGETDKVESQCWKELHEKITNKYVREDGVEMFVQIALIDVNFNPQTVKAFCDSFNYNPRSFQNIYPCEGVPKIDKMVKEFKSNIKIPTVGLSDQGFKRAVYNMLRKTPYGPGNFPGHYLHFSKDFGEEMYKQLTAEEIVPITKRGVKDGYMILNTKQRRNEQLDLIKYHLAAYEYAKDKYFALENEWRVLQKMQPIQPSNSKFMDHMEELLLKRK